MIVSPLLPPPLKPFVSKKISPPGSDVPVATTSISRFPFEGLYGNCVVRGMASVFPKVQAWERLPLKTWVLSGPILLANVVERLFQLLGLEEREIVHVPVFMAVALELYAVL